MSEEEKTTGEGERKKKNAVFDPTPAIEGKEIDSKTLRDRCGITNRKHISTWQRLGLIPKATMRTNPEGRGWMCFFPIETVDRCRTIQRLRGRGLSYPEIAKIIQSAEIKDIPSQGRGRPIELTKDLTKIFVDRIAQGAKIPAISSLVGISKQTIRLWLRRGKREPETIFGKFFRAMQKAQADFQCKAYAVRMGQAKKNPVSLDKLIRAGEKEIEDWLDSMPEEESVEEQERREKDEARIASIKFYEQIAADESKFIEARLEARKRADELRGLLDR